MEITPKLRERFCKDCKLPIKLYIEPYFTNRLELFDSVFDSLSLWYTFKKSVIDNPDYITEQDFYEDYNRIKDEAINFIKNTDAYAKFNIKNMNEFAIPKGYRQFPAKSIFHDKNHGRKFISIDMVKANFSALHAFDSSIFDNAKTWEEFLSKFTSNEYILQSKYIRQVILGNCNPKRHITYEKFLMSCILFDLLLHCSDFFDNVVFFSNDEIIFDITDCEDYVSKNLFRYARKICSDKFNMVPFRVERFTLYKLDRINGIETGYYKEILKDSGEIKIEFKCLDSYNFPFVIRKMRREEIQDIDKVFIFEGRLAKFID